MQGNLKEPSSSGNYQTNWDQYYQRTYRLQKKKALWDVNSALAVEDDFRLFSPYFDSAMPIIDLGCGTGTQSVFLAKHYPKVLGVDVAAEAITVAKANIDEANIEFDTLDVTDFKKAEQIHQVYGDTNLYMRGVLHQILEEDLPSFRQTIKTLMGKNGKMYCIEVSDQIRTYFDKSEGNFSRLPKRMQQVFISNLPPKGLSIDRINTYFPAEEFDVKTSGDTKLNTNIQFSDQEPIFIPAVHVILEPL